ncbi:DUF2029 domain-containing protein [Cupriavidus necator]|uniref:DUF2029 domain-containing protein n=1 Tax=Cupriavidus necator TaxID=106590 RepID=A0A367PQB5_CUPNE|nr:glycosyltransferase family 87 protein [Cupriavidus necator]QQX85079.1 DUF2029 domain-containing protein [Cupriavidus necator]RCJ09246.1 DUF2029 domain-containing protein [Cupriavidus necator]
MSAATENAATYARAAATPHGWLTAERVRLYAAALLIFECALVGAWWYGHWVLAHPEIRSMGWDFAVYWSASGLAQAHGAPAAYDWELLRAAEKPLLHEMFGPFAYPPTFLLLVYPIAAVSYGLALVLTSIAGIMLYLGTVKAALGREPFMWLFPALAFPGLWAALLAGQNSLVTAAACGAALLLMRRNALAAGACISVLCIKPQFGVLFPLLLLCERRWAVTASAAAFSALFLALPALCFGPEIYAAFVRSMAMFRATVSEHATVVLRGAPTVFGVLRTGGADLATSYAGHAVGVAIAVGTCAWIWLTRARLALSASALVVGTLLVQPYMIYYDLAWLAIPLALLAIDMMRHGGGWVQRLVLFFAWLVPAHALLVVVALPTPQVAPVVLFALLGVIACRHLAARRAGQPVQSAGAA